MGKRKLLMFLSMLTLASGTLLAGCSEGKNTDNGSTGGKTASGTAVAEKPKEVYKIEVAQSGSAVPADDIIKKTIDVKIGANVVMSTIDDDTEYLNQLKVRVAAGNYPDLMSVDLATLNDFAKKGLLLDLTPYLDKELKPAKDFMGAGLLKKGMVDGKYYAITRLPDVPFSSFWIRKDWLDNLKLSMPQTIDDLYKVAKAFTENDPDGNGKKDTYGFTGTQFDTFSPIFGAFNVGLPGSVYVKNGKVTDSYFDPNMKDALSYIKKLVDENLVDPTIMTNKGTMARDQAFQGKAGIIWAGWTDVGKQQFIQQYKTINPKAEWVQLGPPKGPGGQFDTSFDTENPSSIFVIPKTLGKNPEKLKKIFDLLNYVSENEGNKLVMYGVEGRDYNMKDGKVVPTDKMAQEGNYFYLYQITGRPNEEYLKTKFPTEENFIKFALSEPRISSFNSSIIPPSGYNAADATRYAQEEFVKFIYGKRQLSEYDAFLKTLEDTFKYKMWLDEANKRAKELGLIN